jgi:hypothetical protein
MAKTGRIGLRIHPQLLKKLEREARAQDRSISWLVESYIKQGLGLMPERQPPQTLNGQSAAA